MKTHLLICALVTALPVLATLPATAVLEVRTGGTSLNGGGFNAARGGTDYTQQTTAQLALTDLSTSGAGATTITTVAGTFTSQMVGNYIHIVSGTGFTAGWYEITTFTDAQNVIVDRTPSAGGAGSAGVANVGGCLSLGTTLDDDQFEIAVPGNIFWIKVGSYSVLGESIIMTAAGTATTFIYIKGYNSTHGDLDTSDGTTTRPILDGGANISSFTFGVGFSIQNIEFTGTAASLLAIGTSCTIRNCKASNTSATASRVALTASGLDRIYDCELISQNGIALSAGPTGVVVVGCYIHDSDTGMNLGTTGSSVVNQTIFENCKTAGMSVTTGAATTVLSCTFYGASATPIGRGFRSTGATSGNNVFFNSIFRGLAVGIEIATVQQDSNVEDWCSFSNNTTDRTLIATGLHSVTTNPNFTAATQITFSTATTSGSVLTLSGGDFSTVTDNIDYLRVVSGTGVTIGTYLITGHNASGPATLTVNNSLNTSSGGDVVGVVYTGHNYLPTGGL